MSFSYGGASSGPIGQVRFTIGDTVEATSRITDEDIAYLLEQTGGSVAQASRLAVESIIATLSNLCDQSVGSVSKSFSQQRDGWKQTLALLKSRSAYAGGRPLVGGISRAQEQLQASDSDTIPSKFTADMMLSRRPGHALVGAIGAGKKLDAP